MLQETGDCADKIPDSDSRPENSRRDKGLYRCLSSKPFLLISFLTAVCFLVFIVHRPALSAKAVSFDDGQYLLDNKLVKNPGWSSTRRFLTEVASPSTVKGYYQPLSMISLMIDYAMGGREDNYTPFHRSSLILHIANTALVILLLYLIFGYIWVAVLVGLLFGLHPLTVETIATVGERKTLLAAFFSFACMVCYICFAKKRAWPIYGVSFFLYLLALMSKPISIPVPLLMILMDYWPLRQFNLRKVLEKVPLLAAGCVFAVITYLSQKNTALVETPQVYGPARIPLVLCHNIVFYLFKIVWPANLSSHYAFPQPLSLSDSMVLAGVIGTAILIPLLLISLLRTRAALTGWLVFFVGVLPTMQIIGFSNVIASDKFVYLPSVGLQMLLASFLIWLCYSSGQHKPLVSRKVVIIVMLILAGLEAGATRQYLTCWKDTASFYAHMLQVKPNAVTLNYNFGTILLQQGNVDEAISCFRKALKVWPDNVEINNNLGTALMAQGNLAEAVHCFQKVLKANNDDIKAGCNLAKALSEQGKLTEAINQYRRVLKIDPDYISANKGIGLTLWRQGNLDEALDHFYRVLKIQPDNALVHYHLAGILQSQGELNEAAEHYRRTLRQMPNHLDALCQLSRIIAAGDQTLHDANQAVALAVKAAQLTGYNDPAVLQTLAIAYATAGQFDRAVEIAEKALNLAVNGQNEALVDDIRNQLKSYKLKEP